MAPTERVWMEESVIPVMEDSISMRWGGSMNAVGLIPWIGCFETPSPLVGEGRGEGV